MGSALGAKSIGILAVACEGLSTCKYCNTTSILPTVGSGACRLARRVLNTVMAPSSTRLRLAVCLWTRSCSKLSSASVDYIRVSTTGNESNTRFNALVVVRQTAPSCKHHHLLEILCFCHYRWGPCKKVFQNDLQVDVVWMKLANTMNKGMQTISYRKQQTLNLHSRPDSPSQRECLAQKHPCGFRRTVALAWASLVSVCVVRMRLRLLGVCVCVCVCGRIFRPKTAHFQSILIFRGPNTLPQAQNGLKTLV